MSSSPATFSVGLDEEDDRPPSPIDKEIKKGEQTPPKVKKKVKNEGSGAVIVVGICAMEKKSLSKPMKEILGRLEQFEYIVTEVFKEEQILNEPVENWPHCDCLVSFFSKGFPLEKAIKYAELRKPFVINDLYQQIHLQDRRYVYNVLQQENIGLPRYAVFDRDEKAPHDRDLVEIDDHIEVNGEMFQKPFVEKPVSAEDHNIYIYYPSSAGGGSQRLFRKIGNRSSVYSPESEVRKKGSYIYEEFMPTDGTDVKVYTVGPDYAHAEARKSPALDGKVARDSCGKEIRHPVLLSSMEKLIARKVCQAFKQTVCGFDLLRAKGGYYVCDVNGFSFVKNSKKYYDDCAKILGNLIMRELAPQYNIPYNIPIEEEEVPYVPTRLGTMMELRCVIGIMRHGDRTPKQKMKMEVKHRKFFEVFEKYGGFKNGKIKLKKPTELQELLDVSRFLLAEMGNTQSGTEIEEKKGKLEQLRTVLEMYGKFSGINRKVQMKYQPKGRPGHVTSDDDTKEEASLLLIVKWGGELTSTGKLQAEELGRAFRCIYPGGQGEYAGFPGCGLLRLHSTYRHDLKIYASDEGRVQMTAAAFTKSMLALEGELTPILVQMVKSSHGLLDFDKDCLTLQSKVKQRLYDLMKKDHEFTKEDVENLAPTKAKSLLESIDFIKNPVEKCEIVHNLVKHLVRQIKEKMKIPEMRDFHLNHNETLGLMLKRWSKLEKDFKMKNGTFDITKIPDIYDCIKYDCIHNGKLDLDKTGELLQHSQYLANIIVPSEYGMSVKEKVDIGKGICLPLLKKIQRDLQRVHEEDENVHRLNPEYTDNIGTPERHVQTRLYFTSESHIHSLINCLRLGGLIHENGEQWKRAAEYLGAVKELNYMTQIVIMLYEDPNTDPASPERFHVELHFSPGVRGQFEDEDLTDSCGFQSCSTDHLDVPSSMGDKLTVPNQADKKRSSFSSEMSHISASSLEEDTVPDLSIADKQTQCSVQNTSLKHCMWSAPAYMYSLAGGINNLASGITGMDSYLMSSTIHPLETLHNSLSLKQVEDFLDQMTAEENHFV